MFAQLADDTHTRAQGSARHREWFGSRSHVLELVIIRRLMKVSTDKGAKIFMETINHLVPTSMRKTLPCQAKIIIEDTVKLHVTLAPNSEMETIAMRSVNELIDHIEMQLLLQWIQANRKIHLGVLIGPSRGPFVLDLSSTKFVNIEGGNDRDDCFLDS